MNCQTFPSSIVTFTDFCKRGECATHISFANEAARDESYDASFEAIMQAKRSAAKHSMLGIALTEVASKVFFEIFPPRSLEDVKAIDTHDARVFLDTFKAWCIERSREGGSPFAKEIHAQRGQQWIVLRALLRMAR